MLSAILGHELYIATNQMKTTLFIFTILMTGCISKQESPQELVAEARKTFMEAQEISNANSLAWDNLIDSIYKIADTNRTLSFDKLDHLINYDNSLDKFKLSELHFVKGDIYYRIDSFRNAVEEYTLATEPSKQGTPKELEARAGAYIKLKQFDKAFSDLTTASKMNYEFLWSVGNYYEIINKKDSAIACYNRLYWRDSVNCKEGKERVIELKKTNPKLLTELIFRSRQRIKIELK